MRQCHGLLLIHVSILIIVFATHACRPLVVTKSLIATMNQIISQRNREFTIHLLKAIPLLHFLRGDCTPHEQRVVQPSKIKWLDPDIHLGTVHSETFYEKMSVIKLHTWHALYMLL